MIPKVMNFFWVGKKMSWLRYMTLYSFCKLNPGWEVNLYLNDFREYDNPWSDHHTQDFFMYKGPDYLDRVDSLPVKIQKMILPFPVNPVCQSDLFQWLLLGNDGGFYSDLDILYIRPIDYAIWSQHSTVCCLAENEFTIGFLGACEGNQFFKDIAEEALQQYNDREYQSAGINSVYGIIRNKCNRLHKSSLISDISKAYPELSVFNLPQETIYPWAWHNAPVKIFYENNKLSLNTVGVHWYAGAPISQEYNNLLNENTYRDLVCTYSSYAAEVI